MTRNLSVPDVDDSGEVVPEPNAVAKFAATIASQYQVNSFRGRPMLVVDEPFPHFVPLHKDRFDKLAYPHFGGLARSKMGDIFAYLSNVAEDLSENDHMILFGLDLPTATMHPELTDYDAFFASENKQSVWNMRDVMWDHSADKDATIWRSPYPRIKQPKEQKTRERLPFIMQLAGGDEGLYDDIMQSMAPVIMERKPDGVVWWVGDGANGKSTLMDALYRLFPGQFSSITVKRLTDGRDTPSLNGTLANIVRESSEGRIDDTEIYKSIGTHENFRVHKFHSQDDIEIRGNLHHIFSGNSIPAFNDKGFSARRRTFVIPFVQRFDSDPTFEEKTFTAEFFGKLVDELTHYAYQIKKQGYRYKWSAATLAAKLEYDTEANSAEEYGSELIKEGIVAFDSFSPLKMDYENWCADNGYVPLGMGNLRRAMQTMGFNKITYREGTHVAKHYRLTTVEAKDLQALGMGRPGLFTTQGFEPASKPEPAKPASDTIPPSIIGDRW